MSRLEDHENLLGLSDVENAIKILEPTLFNSSNSSWYLNFINYNYYIYILFYV